jgi:hypothetical protein
MAARVQMTAFDWNQRGYGPTVAQGLREGSWNAQTSRGAVSAS